MIRKDKDFCNTKNIKNYRWKTEDQAQKKVPKTLFNSSSQNTEGREDKGEGGRREDTA